MDDLVVPPPVDFSIVPYAVHDGDGRILRHGTATGIDHALAQAQPGEAVVTGQSGSDLTHYVDIQAGQIVLRPEMEITVSGTEIIADGHEAVVISGVPIGAMLVINGVEEGVVEDGQVEFDALESGTYRLEIHHWPYKDFNIEVTAQ